jgi:hypothetical protein
MADSGVNLVSFYIPWRLHERHLNGATEFDFVGGYHPQTDVRHFLTLVKESNLKAIIKPGPFIHAEVQFGGIPNRIIFDEEVVRHTGRGGGILPSQGCALPSFFDPKFKLEVQAWLYALSTQVLQEHIDDGTIMTFQLGNEGVLGELCYPIGMADVSSAALPHFSEASGIDMETLKTLLAQSPRTWNAEFKQVFCNWSANATVIGWKWLSDQLPKGPRRLVNIPLAKGEGSHFYSWMLRANQLRQVPYDIGHTEWVGNIANDPDAFFAHCTEIQILHSNSAETNWGFTWTDQSFAEGVTPIFHALLALMLGSETVSLYSACVGEEWLDDIDMKADGVWQDGLDPELFEPPYCAGAPFQDGMPGVERPNREAYDRLVTFLDQHGSLLYGSCFASGEVREMRLDHLEALAIGISGNDCKFFDELRTSIMCRQIIAHVEPIEKETGVLGLKIETAKLPDNFLVTSPNGNVRLVARYNYKKCAWLIGAFNPTHETCSLHLNMNECLYRFCIPPNNALIIRCDMQPQVIFNTSSLTPAVEEVVAS